MATKKPRSEWFFVLNNENGHVGFLKVGRTSKSILKHWTATLTPASYGPDHARFRSIRVDRVAHLAGVPFVTTISGVRVDY